MPSETRDVQLLAPEPSPTLSGPVPAPVRAPGLAVPERIRVPAADGFRACAALSVVLYHCMYGAGLPPLGSDLLRNYLVAGLVGVDFFFVLSGFLLFLPVAAAQGRFGDVRSYALRRVTRILPAYYVALVATVGLLLFLSRTPAFGLTRHNVALNVLLHATFLQHNLGSALGLPEGFGFNGVVWTLSIEALFYAILPLVAVRFFRRPVLGLGLGLGIAAAWRLAVAHSTLHVASLPGVATPAAARLILITQIPSFAGHFALGMMAAWLFVKMRRSRFAGSPWTVALQVLGLAGIVLSMELIGHRDMAKIAGPLDHWTTTTPLAVSFAVLLLSTALAPQWAQRPVTNPVARHLGDISYGVYLSHLLFVELALTTLHFFPAGNLVAFLRMVGFVGAGSLLVGWASFVWVERPLTRWARRRSGRG
ncbi:MAG: acyltransferase family protein [Candidatus Dormibacteria bacterium]